MSTTVARERVNVGAVIAAIFLPPLGVFLERGLGPQFWIATVLTLLAFVPGAVFALLAVLHYGV